MNNYGYYISELLPGKVGIIYFREPKVLRVIDSEELSEAMNYA